MQNVQGKGAPEFNFVWITSQFTMEYFRQMLEPKIGVLTKFFAKSYQDKPTFNLWVDREVDSKTLGVLEAYGVQVHYTNELYENLEKSKDLTLEEINSLKSAIAMESGVGGVSLKDGINLKTSDSLKRMFKANPAIAKDMLEFMILARKPCWFLDLGLNTLYEYDNKKGKYESFSREMDDQMRDLGFYYIDAKFYGEKTDYPPGFKTCFNKDGTIRKDFTAVGVVHYKDKSILDLQIMASSEAKESKQLFIDALKQCVLAWKGYANQSPGDRRRTFGSRPSGRYYDWAADQLAKCTIENSESKNKNNSDFVRFSLYDNSIKFAGCNPKERQKSLIVDYKNDNYDVKQETKKLRAKYGDESKIPSFVYRSRMKDGVKYKENVVENKDEEFAKVAIKHKAFDDIDFLLQKRKDQKSTDQKSTDQKRVKKEKNQEDNEPIVTLNPVQKDQENQDDNEPMITLNPVSKVQEEQEENESPIQSLSLK